MGGLAEVGHFPQGWRFDPLCNPTLPTKCFDIEQMLHNITCALVRVKRNVNTMLISVYKKLPKPFR